MNGSILICESLSNLYRPQKDTSGTEEAVALKPLMCSEVKYFFFRSVLSNYHQG